MDEYHNQNRNSDEQANNQPPSSDSPYPQSGQTDCSQQWQQPNNLPDNCQPWQGELQNNQSYWQNGPQNNQQPWQNRQQDNQYSWQNGPQNNQPYWQNGPQNNQSYWQNGPQDNQSYWQQQGGQQYWQQPPRQQNNLSLASMISTAAMWPLRFIMDYLPYSTEDRRAAGLQSVIQRGQREKLQSTKTWDWCMRSLLKRRWSR